jgi:hypothetical protein
MNAERVEDVVPNAFGGSLGGTAIGGAVPLATGLAGKMTRPLFTTKKAPITIPTKEQLKAIKPQSKYNPNKKLTREEADALLRDRTAIQKLGIYNDELSYNDNAIDKRLGIQHLLGETRNPYIRTLNNTINKPDVKFTWDGREFNAKMYENGDTGKNFMDWIITEDGKLVAKYPTTANHVANQIENGAQNMSLSARVPTGYDGATYAQLPIGTTNNVTSNARNVKKNTPNLKRIADFWNNYGRRYSPQYLTPYLAQYLANQQ